MFYAIFTQCLLHLLITRRKMISMSHVPYVSYIFTRRKQFFPESYMESCTYFKCRVLVAHRVCR